MNKVIRVGSRESALAVRQAQIVVEAVKARYPALQFELVTVATSGDKNLDARLDKIGGKGLFTKELEQALSSCRIDIAVHSYKDMPYEETDGLPVVALSKREAPFDALVLPNGVSEMDKTKPVGSSSLRRSIQFTKLYEGFSVDAVRGNVHTRLAKLDRGEYAALILAQAGLSRLSLQDRIFRVFTADEMIPSASQGILAAQGREREDYAYLDAFHSEEAEIVSQAERQFLQTLGCDCSSPVAAYGEIHGREILLRGMVAGNSGEMITGRISGGIEDARRLGETLAKQLIAR